MNSVDLRLFIKQALLDIIGGVADAQKEAPPGSIAPSDINQTFESVQHNLSHLQPIGFELQVVADNSSATGAKIGVLGAIVGASAQGEAKDATKVHSTLKFTVPVHLPGGGLTWSNPKANKALEPTPPSVTPPADAGVAPAGVVAHL